jgi:hypothetical protein
MTMRLWRRWEVTLGAGFYGSRVGYQKPKHYPFRWMADLRVAIWKTLNFFPGRLVGHVRRLP